MSSRATARRRYQVKYYVRTDDPLQLLVYDALKTMAADTGRGLAGVSWTLAILGLLAACGEDPRPLAKRLALHKVSEIDRLLCLLPALTDKSAVDAAIPASPIGESAALDRSTSEQHVAAVQPAAIARMIDECSAGQTRKADTFDLEQFLRLGQPLPQGTGHQ